MVDISFLFGGLEVQDQWGKIFGPGSRLLSGSYVMPLRFILRCWKGQTPLDQFHKVTTPSHKGFAFISWSLYKGAIETHSG